MATKSSGTTRKSTSKKATAKQSSTVTPISQPNGVATPAEFERLGQLDPGIEEEIRRRAYEIYEARGRQDGMDQEDWAQAEEEVMARYLREKSA